MPEETTTLRAAAQRLARIRRPKGKGIESSRLFSLLRSGELKAGFYILGKTEWIEIPVTYWLGINSSKFRLARTDDPKSGTYTIRATEFPDQVARLICSEIRLNEETLRQHQIESDPESIADVIKATARPYEVTIKTKDFSDYLQQHDLKEKTETRGNKEKQSWRDVCSYMAAYMIAHYKEGLTDLDSASEIVDLAKEDGVKNLPSPATLKDQVSKMKDLLKKPKFKRNK